MDTITLLRNLLDETARAHHAAFAAADGHDPEWPLWYADYLNPHLEALLGARYTRSKVVYLLMSLDEQHRREAPDQPWADFYAAQWADFTGSAGTADASRPPAITGLGGIFFKSDDPAKLKSWYIRHFGIKPQRDGSVIFEWTERDRPERPGFTVWGPFSADTTYFDPSTKPFMFNFRVDNLDELLARLRREGVTVDDKVDDYPYGRFGWCMDPEGNRIELWEPQ